LVGAGFALVAEMADCTRGPRRDLGTAVWGWENGFDPRGWVRMLEGFHRDPHYNPLMNAYIARMPNDGKCLARTDLIPDSEWYRSDYYLEAHCPMGADATLACFQPIPEAEDEFEEIFLVRAVGEKDFSSRDKAVVREAMASVVPLVGGPLARFGDLTPEGLPLRARQVLQCLLEGDSDKEIGTRLEISRFTVNFHTKVIYRHFGVSGRAELLALWVRRGWGSRLHSFPAPRVYLHERGPLREN
jgi:DNA-binding CsgD family transcriptional regulator